MQCDMCGTKKASSVALVEGTELNVCDECAKFGKRIKAISTPRPMVKYVARPQKPLPAEPIIMIVPDYGKLIKDAREKMGMKQSEVALKISEKESLLHGIESSRHEPSIDVAKKLERFFKIKLIEQLEDKGDGPVKGSAAQGFTIADFIKKSR